VNATVLFADVSGAAALYRAAGHAVALKAISHCIEQVRNAARSTDGRIVKLIGDEVMVLFATPDAAAKAAAKMHQSVEALPPVQGTKLGLRVGFHSGPVFRRDRDLLGDTVKLAAKLLEQAQKGQTITTGQTAAQLSPGMRPFSRELERTALAGKAETIRLCEMLPSLANGAARAQEVKARIMMRLSYHDQVAICSRETPRIVIGRQDCDLVIADTLASRQHCTLEVRGGKFVLRDHSTNGTYVTVEGEHEILLNGEELALAAHGWIAFGHPHGGSAEAVEFLGS
jgi:adenylate cyclase